MKSTSNLDSSMSGLNEHSHSLLAIPNPSKRAKRISKDQPAFSDYQLQIKRELSKANYEALDEEQKKQVVIRIRNRMSAQRSRTRQKEMMSDFVEIAEELQRKNSELEAHNRELESLVAQQSLAGEPTPGRLFELENEVRLLRESLVCRMAEQKKVAQRVLELELVNEELRRQRELAWVREKGVEAPPSPRLMLFFVGLLMVSGIVYGNSRQGKLKAMGFSLGRLRKGNSESLLSKSSKFDERRPAFEALKRNLSKGASSAEEVEANDRMVEDR